jgi:hypothetical protein
MREGCRELYSMLLFGSMALYGATMNPSLSLHGCSCVLADEQWTAHADLRRARMYI